MVRTLAAILLLVSLSTWADTPRHQGEFVSDNGRFVFLSIHGSIRRVPLFEDGVFTRYIEIGSGEEEIWGVFDARQAVPADDLIPGAMMARSPLYTVKGHFASRSAFVGDDGSTVTIVDDFSEREPSESLEVLHFFRDGRLIRAYTLGELLDDPLKNVKPTASHFIWLWSLGREDGLLQLETAECRQLTLDVGTGEVTRSDRGTGECLGEAP